jgi:hypothetical protein
MANYTTATPPKDFDPEDIWAPIVGVFAANILLFFIA